MPVPRPVISAGGRPVKGALMAVAGWCCRCPSPHASRFQPLCDLLLATHTPSASAGAGLVAGHGRAEVMSAVPGAILPSTRFGWGQAAATPASMTTTRGRPDGPAH